MKGFETFIKAVVLELLKRGNPAYDFKRKTQNIANKKK